MQDKVFDKKYKQLNTAQKDAVDSIDGPVMVIAGPGTGKTTILTLRIANILKKTDTPPSGILAITYTEAGAKAMRMKLREVIGIRADEVRIHTFHGFAASIIKEFDEHFVHLAKSTQITDIEAEVIIREILKSPKFSDLRPAGEPEFYVGKILSAIGEAKGEAWTSEMIRSFARDEIKRIKSDDESISSRGVTKGQLKGVAQTRIKKCERTLVFADVYEAYEEKKRKDKKIDFADLIIELLSALKNDELLLRLLQEKFLYILVDEHQDTNDAQNLLVRMIADFFEAPNLFVVGDEKQAIYRFQGASVENFLKFQNAWQEMKVISLEDNYRSHQSILDASFALIEQNYVEGEYKNLRIKLNAGGEEQSRPVDIVSAGNTEAGEKYLVGQVREILDKKPGKTVAVITTKNKDVERILSVFEANNIPASSERGADIFKHPAGILFFDLIQYLSSGDNIEALARTIVGGLWGLSFEDSTKLVREIRSGILKDITKSIPSLNELKKESMSQGALAYIIHSAQVSGFVRLISRDPLAVEVWRGILALSGELMHGREVNNPQDLMHALLAYATSAESKSVKIGVGAPDALVRVMTAHGSKGLEFDYVFIPYATEEAWVSKARGSYFILPREKDDGDEIRDMRRLFYVAITRARAHVVIISGKEESDGKPLTPLRFISELSAENVATIDIPALREKAFTEKPVDVVSNRERALGEYIKRTMLERGLSVTALNHFLSCPSQFLYKSIIRLPEAPQAGSERGNAMHEAISHIWRLEDRNDKSVLSTLESGIRAYFEEKSLLPLFEKQAITKELLDDVPAVVKALSSHFNTTGDISTEIRMEKRLEQISLNGKLDTVIEKENEVLVFDYKTREAMSENEIRGTTKNSTGDYFRQLVFYKILLEASPRFKGKSIIPALVFIRPDDKGRCPIIQLPITKADEEQVLNDIHALVESVWSGSILSARCNDAKCEWCKLRDFTSE